ncbi:MAG: histidine kinase [Flavobacteriaceae bacterium]|nr:histidine kinase [Flavobacteriaceae bacterium]
MISPLHAQIISLNDTLKYERVFVDTDNFGASYLDTLQANYKKIRNRAIKFEVLNDLAYYWHTRNLTEATVFVKEGLQEALRLNDSLWHGRFQITQGAILLRQEKLDSAQVILEAAKLKVTEEDLPHLNTQLGYIYERRGELDKAADYAMEALRIGIERNDKRAKAVAYSDLSNLFWKLSKFKQGLDYGLQSLDFFEERGINDLDYGFTLYVVGNNLLGLKEYDRALQYFEHSKTIGERYGFYNNLSDVYISLVDLYAFLKRYDEAENAGVNALKYAELLDNEFMVMRSWLSIGQFQHREGRFNSSIESLKKSIRIATSDFGDEYYLSQAYETLGQSYAGNHDYKNAYQAFAQYDALKSEIFTTEADQRISLLQTEFDVAQKESTIKVQETQINQQKTRQKLMIVIGALLLLLLLILLKTYDTNRKKNKLLNAQNIEKEFLLKEIHHRVKNNLEVISSLLSLQSAQMDDPTVIEAMKESQNRVLSMSMIHQRLYQGENLGSVDMKDYFVNLGRHILDSFGVDKSVELNCVMDTVELDVDTAIPLGLIVNELLTNALKYAFPEGRQGKINIELKRINKSKLILKVTDNGIGQMDDDFTKGKGFGMQLLQLLTQQLNGEMEHMKSNGTIVMFEFKIDNV